MRITETITHAPHGKDVYTTNIRVEDEKIKNLDGSFFYGKSITVTQLKPDGSSSELIDCTIDGPVFNKLLQIMTLLKAAT